MGGAARSHIARLLNEPATQTLIVVNATQVQWLRGGTAPEVEPVTFEVSTDSGATWTALGNGARISGGWSKTGLSLPPTGMIRARGRATAGLYNGSSSLLEQMTNYALPDIGVLVGETNLVDGVGTVSFGTVASGQTGPTLTFMVTNAGFSDLTLGTVTLTGSGAPHYLLDTTGLATSLAPGATTTFTVAFSPMARTAAKTATLRINSNDADESPFRIALSGTRIGADPGFNPDANSSVSATVVQPDGKILVGGNFTMMGGVPRTYIARLNNDGTLDPSFIPSASSNVTCVAVQADGKILVGGLFTTVNGNARNRIARLNADGSLDPGFNPDANSFVRSLAVQGDGKILLGGYFTAVGGVPRNYLARLNADGTLDTGFNPSPNNYILSVAVQADGKILLGGWFTTVGGTTRNYLARLDAGGTLDLGFDPSANDWVYSLGVQADGKILLGGTFTGLGGTTRNRVARLNGDGTLDTGFNPNASGGVTSIGVQTDGQILLGGWFTTMGGTTRNYIARLNPDGALDPGFNPNPNCAGH